MWLSCAVCGDGLSYTIQVQFSGNSSCVARVFSNGAQVTISSAQASCTATLFPGKTCRTLNGNLYLFATNQVNATAATFFQPRFDTALAALGVGSLATIEYVLSLVVDHSPNPIPVNMAPVFLTTLRDVFTIQVIESIDYTNLPEIPPPVPRLVGLPGLAGVRRIVAPTGSGFEAFTVLKVQGTAMKDLTSFSGLVCPPNNINITDNLQLTSLNGLNGLSTWTSNIFGPNVFILNNNLTGSSSVGALATLAGCPTTSLIGSTAPLSPQIQVVGCSTFTVSSYFFLCSHASLFSSFGFPCLAISSCCLPNSNISVLSPAESCVLLDAPM